MPARLALTLLAAAAVVAALGITAARRNRPVQRARTILVYADRLREGAPVSYRGVEVGRLDRLAFDTTGVVLELVFNRAVPLRTSDTVQVRSLGLFGDLKLEILPGPPTAPRLPENGILPAFSIHQIPPTRLYDLLKRPPETVYRDARPPVPRP